jgi:glycosyltransferase involved in cell wall biosynthesis
MITVSIIVPAYNEERTIIALLERVKAQRVDGVEFQILVVDDGSRDRTVALIEARPDLGVNLIRRARNGGKGAAVRDALLAATGDFVLFQDADLEYDPAEYARLLGPVLHHEADVVLGSRLVASPVTRVHYFWNRVGNKGLTLMFNLFHNTTFTDIYTCYVLFRRTLIEPRELRSVGWEQQAEILSLLSRRAKGIFEVPISYFGRTYEEGKKIRAVHALGVAWAIVSVRFRPA